MADKWMKDFNKVSARRDRRLKDFDTQVNIQTNTALKSLEKAKNLPGADSNIPQEAALAKQREQGKYESKRLDKDMAGEYYKFPINVDNSGLKKEKFP